MVEIPLDANVNQEFGVTLDGQDCTLHVYQRGRRVYLDLTVDGETIKNGVMCVPVAPLIRSSTFAGQLYIVDTLAPDVYSQTAPDYAGLGDRYRLVYLTEDEADELDS